MTHDTLNLARALYALCKPKVVMLILLTAVVGMVLAVEQWSIALVIKAFWATLGIGLAASAAAVVNHIIDRHIDARMGRTDQRPLPKAQVSARDAWWFAGVLSVLSASILWATTNMLTTILTLSTLMGYAVIYTMFLKHATPQNIVIGGATGAAPPVLGWVAMTGHIHPYALLLFLIVFVWTPPHFWALAIARRDEYAKADVPMLPVTHGIAFTKWHMLFYTVLLCLVSLMPALVGMTHGIYLVCAVGLGGWFMWHVLKLFRDDSHAHAMPTFGVSIWYLMFLFVALMIDHKLPVTLI